MQINTAVVHSDGKMIDWTIGGVNTSSTSGGPVCRNFMPDSWRLRESFMVVTLAMLLVIWGCYNLTFPKNNTHVYKYQTGKILLLVIFSIAFGIEVGFKFATKTVIYLLNPCHIMTVMQLYLLSVTPSNKVTAIFRVHLSLLNGPILAFLFPETNNRRLPFEKWIYWIQHILLFIVPIYLLKQGGVYNVEPIHDMSWVTLSYGLNILYHYILLQPLAIPTEVNLNHMLCPAEKDPFSGSYYRILAVIHQGILCPLMYKLASYYFATSVNDDDIEFIYKKLKTSPTKVNGMNEADKKVE